MNKIKENSLYDKSKIKFEINDTYDNIDKACKSRFDIFELDNIQQYEKILYLDTDIIVKNDIHKVFQVCKLIMSYLYDIDEFRTSCLSYKTEEVCENLYLKFNKHPKQKERKMHSILNI